ncbi:MAG: hypothetical protein ACE14L_07425 [Terriglobales bacterium]
MSTFDPGSRGFPLRHDFDHTALEKLLYQLQEFDPDLERHLREELLGGGPPALTKETFEKLLHLSQTNGIYSPVQDIARSISELLFGRPLG